MALCLALPCLRSIAAAAGGVAKSAHSCEYASTVRKKGCACRMGGVGRLISRFEVRICAP